MTKLFVGAVSAIILVQFFDTTATTFVMVPTRGRDVFSRLLGFFFFFFEDDDVNDDDEKYPRVETTEEDHALVSARHGGMIRATFL